MAGSYTSAVLLLSSSKGVGRWAPPKNWLGEIPENDDLGTDTVLELLTLHLSQAPWGCSSGVLVFGDRVTCQRRSESSLSRASLFPQLPKASSPSRKWMHSSCTSPSSPKRMSSSRPCRTSPPGERWPHAEQTPWAWAGKGGLGDQSP